MLPSITIPTKESVGSACKAALKVASSVPKEFKYVLIAALTARTPVPAVAEEAIAKTS